MRRNDTWAWGEFCVRFEPVLKRYARARRIPPDDRNDCVSDALHRAALHLARPKTDIPANLEAYLVTCLSRHIATLSDEAGKRDGAHRDAAEYQDVGDDVTAVVRTTVSECALRWASDVTDGDEVAEPPPNSAGVRALTELVGTRVTPEERQILEWLAQGVPQTIIAEWLDANYRAMAKRIERLRHRLRAQANEDARRLPEPLQRAVRNFICRATE
jgi:DNA-directed RNA polymerase specialized sigma24 family protein